MMKFYWVIAFCFLWLQLAGCLDIEDRPQCPERCLAQRPKSDRQPEERRRRVAYFSTTRKRCRLYDFYGPRPQQSNIFVTIDACEFSCNFCKFLLGRNRSLTLNSQDGFFPPGRRLLRNVQKFKCLRSKNSGGDLEIVGCDVGDGSQHWNAAAIRRAQHWNEQFHASSKCLTVVGGSNDNGVKVKLADCEASAPPSQDWMIVNGNYWENFQIRNARSAGCLTYDDTNALYLWDCTAFASAPHQYFSLIFPRSTIGILESYKYKKRCLHGKSSNPYVKEMELTVCDTTSDDQLVDLSVFVRKFWFLGLALFYICQNLHKKYDYIFWFKQSGPSSRLPHPVLLSGWWCMDVTGGGLGDGSGIIQWSCTHGNNQKWRILGSLSTPFQIQNLQSGRCVTVENLGTINQWECGNINSAPHQFFTVQLPHSDVGILQNVAYDTKCIHPKGTQENAKLELVDCDQARTDEWVAIQSKSDPTVYIRGKCLVANGDMVRQQTCDTASPNQVWTIKIDSPQDPEIFRIENQATNKCIAVQEDGALVVELECVAYPGGRQQHWKFI